MQQPLVQTKMYDVSNESLKKLRPGTWLNDELINAYVSLINQRLVQKPSGHTKMLCLNSWFMSQLEDDLAKDQYTKQKLEKRVKRQINGFNTLYNKITGKKGKMVGSLADLDMLLIPVN